MDRRIAALTDAVKQLDAIIEDQFEVCGDVSAVLWNARQEALDHLTALRRETMADEPV